MSKEEVIETYSAEIKPQKDLDIVFKEESGFEDVINEDGVIPTKLNEKVIIQRIARDLYKNADSGIRELYMNAVRGCEDGVAKYGYKNPRITVTLNEAERIIIIKDNGRGITKARFKQVLRELGTSDNFDGTTTGQFGMGFASYLTLSSAIILDTIGDNGDNYKMICRDGSSSKYAGKSDLDEHGVKLTLTCYPEVEFDSVCKKLYEVARHAKVPTTVIIEEFEYSPDDFDRGSNEVEQVSFEDDVTEEIREGGIVKIDTEDFCLIASDSVAYDNGKVSLLNVPIDSEIEVPFSWWILNIKNERKFQPMPDRDRMREESDKTLQALIESKLRAHFSDIEITDYPSYINSSRRHDFLWLIDHPSYAPEALVATLERLQQCSGLRKIDYVDKTPSTHSLLYWLRLAGEGGVIYQGSKSKVHTDKVIPLIHEKCIPIIAKKSKNDNWKESVAILEEFGVPTVKQTLKDAKVKVPKRVKGEAEEKYIIAHNHSRYYETEEVPMSDIDDSYIRVDSMAMAKMISFVRGYPTDMKFMRNEPSLKETDCQMFSEWIESFKTVEVMTNKGPILADTLAQQEVTYCDDLSEELRPIVEGLEETMIIDNAKILGVVLLKYLEHNINRTENHYNLMHSSYLDTIFTDKYGIKMYSDEAKKFFCRHLVEILPAYHELFARVIAKVQEDYADEVALREMEKYLEVIKKFGELDGEDEIAKLKFYHSRWMNLPNKGAGITRIFDEMMTKSINKIRENNFMLAKFIEEEALPKLFGTVVVRKLVQIEEGHYRNDEFKVTFTTNYRSLVFSDDIKVYGVRMEFKNLSIRIFNKHSLVNVNLEISS